MVIKLDQGSLTARSVVKSSPYYAEDKTRDRALILSDKSRFPNYMGIIN